jgi:hypothetical protein
LIKENDRLKAQLGIAERKPDENRKRGRSSHFNLKHIFSYVICLICPDNHE